MKWRIDLGSEAGADIDSAAAWYEEQRKGLGRDFVQAIREAMVSLARGPLIPRLQHRTAGIRWVYPKRFPYRIIYRVETDRIVVFAVMHTARHDVGWRQRLK